MYLITIANIKLSRIHYICWFLSAKYLKAFLKQNKTLSTKQISVGKVATSKHLFNLQLMEAWCLENTQQNYECKRRMKPRNLDKSKQHLHKAAMMSQSPEVHYPSFKKTFMFISRAVMRGSNTNEKCICQKCRCCYFLLTKLATRSDENEMAHLSVAHSSEKHLSNVQYWETPLLLHL